MVTVSTGSEHETQAVAEAFAGQLRAGDFITLEGDVGAGKSTFVRGACVALGVTEHVRSPTYVTAHMYAGALGEIAHLDLYRQTHVDVEHWADIEPIIEDSFAAFIEWPNPAKQWIASAITWQITLEHVDHNRRLISISAAMDDERARACADAVCAAVS